LTSHGFPTSVDGDFGKNTLKVVLTYQESVGLEADGIVGKGTWASLLAPTEGGAMLILPAGLTEAGILAQFKKLGYTIHEEEYVCNFFGIRSPIEDANSFDDIMGCFVKINGEWHFFWWPATTDPGTYWLENPSRVEGTAMLVEGQYDAWKIDLHRSSYEALCQRADEVSVYRDADRDNKLDPDPETIMKGWFGINLHRSSSRGESTKVNKWSAGCQVHALLAGFQKMMALARQQVAQTEREVFTYTLLKQWW
tara:strand:+ start:492 stop:1250 length:759 start_codon:yes stop_codon:yes gene_type:complete